MTQPVAGQSTARFTIPMQAGQTYDIRLAEGCPVNVPFFVAGTVDNVVLRRLHGADRSVPGLRVHIGSSDGSYAAVVPVFADGSFHLPGLPPGRYTAQIDAAQLDFLGVIAAPRVREFGVRVTRDGDFVEGIDFLLVPRPAPDAEPRVENGRQTGAG